MSTEPKVEVEEQVVPMDDLTPPMPPTVEAEPPGEVRPPLPEPENEVPIPLTPPVVQPPSGIGV